MIAPVRPLSRRRAPLRAGSILCYHSVTSARLPSASDAHVPIDALTGLVRLARRIGEIVPLVELIERHRAGRSTAGLFAITFDDAYHALLEIAADLIHREQVPVTVFAVANACAAGSSFWWDRVEDLIVRVPPARWREFETACGLPDEFRTGQPARFGRLRPLRQWLLATYRGRCPAELDALLSALEQEFEFRTLHRSMNLTELRSFASVPWVDIGVHTLSHPVLPLLPPTEAATEIADSFQFLRNNFERVVPVLAVPYGLFDRGTVRLAREAGMEASLSLGGTTLRVEPAELVLPRLYVGEQTRTWKLVLRMLGLRELLNHDREAAAREPELPSCTT